VVYVADCLFAHYNVVQKRSKPSAWTIASKDPVQRNGTSCTQARNHWCSRNPASIKITYSHQSQRHASSMEVRDRRLAASKNGRPKSPANPCQTPRLCNLRLKFDGLLIRSSLNFRLDSALSSSPCSDEVFGGHRRGAGIVVKARSPDFMRQFDGPRPLNHRI
jgi:hypothetical protein